MKIKIIICILIIIVVCISIFIIKHFNNKNNEPIKHEDIKKGRLELVYSINAGIPFKWVYEIGDEDIVQFEESYQIRNDNTDGRSGGAIDTKYVFKGIKEGTTTITFKYMNIDGALEKEIIHHVSVDKDNNVTLIDDNTKE